MCNKPELSILIVNWNSVRFLEKCLRSVYANTTDLGFEIIVVDNASYDGSQQMVRENFPQVKFIQNATNEGFARANNLAFHHSRGQYVLFLNPDTEVLRTALTEMVRFLERTPDAGIVAPKLLNSDFTIQTTSIMRFPTIVNEALDFDRLHRAFPGCKIWDISILYRKDSTVAEQVEAVSGACMMMRRNVFEAIGYFETNYFMFTEDLDLCYKSQRDGWKNYYFGGATLIHHGGASTASAPNGFRTVMIQASHVEFLRMRHGKQSAVLYKASMTLVAIARLTVLGVIAVVTLGRYKRRWLFVAWAKWAAILRWATHPVGAANELLPLGLSKRSSWKAVESSRRG